MSKSVFWLYKDFFGDRQISGFSFFSLPHLIWLAILFVLTVVYVLSYRHCGERGRSNLRNSMAMFLILLEILKICVMALTDATVKQGHVIYALIGWAKGKAIEN